MDNNSQRQTSGMSPPGPELHLHHHHASAPAPLPNDVEGQHRMARMHPLMAATYMLFLSIAISIPLALLAAIVDGTNRPNIQYIHPPARW